MNLNLILKLMEKYLLSHPSADIIDYAKEVMSIFYRSFLPDWIEILANGNPERLDSVIEVAISDLGETKADECRV